MKGTATPRARKYFSFQQASCAVLDKKTFQSGGVVKRGQLDVEAGGGRSLLDCGRDGAEVLEAERAHV